MTLSITSLPHLMTYLERHKVHLIAVTKYATVDQMKQLYDHGICHFGENTVQKAGAKQACFNPPDSHWHMIGHVQRNKVEKAMAIFDSIQSVDSLALAERINRVAKKKGIVYPVYIQVNITGDEARYGFSVSECMDYYDNLVALSNIMITGMMIMGAHPASPQEIQTTFKNGKALFDQLVMRYTSIQMLSMGMSHDFEYAVAHGATQVRIGSLLYQLL